jgi:hypothetical protein
MSQLRTRQVLSMAKVFSTVVLSLLLQGSGTIFEIDLWRVKVNLCLKPHLDNYCCMTLPPVHRE